MTANFPLFLIPLLPLLGAAFSLMLGKRAGKNAVTLVACGAVGASLLVAARAVYVLATELPGGTLTDSFFTAPWIKAGDLTISASLVLDHLSSVMVLIITGVGSLIHVYSTAYMEHDEGYTRFFGYLNLFMGAMLILVLGDSLPVTFVGWEGVGLCSYLLIGFWYDKDANALAGRKAFIVNRVGDFGFLLAMFLLFHVTGTLKYSELGGDSIVKALQAPMWLGAPAALFITLLVLLGATGKSAQIPLYVWLPDAMAGPTPVSALIHAATMVTAGVYVVTRMHIVFEVAPQSLAVVAIVGALTALFAATIGIAQRDLKKVLAYSTISQLGFMFAACGSYIIGTSNYQAGIFHLATHAFFKAGLFLGAGSVMHAMSGEGDITRMGGLKKYLPHTRWTFLIYCCAIAGIPPFAGFWSKDSILGGAYAALWSYKEGAGGAEKWLALHLGTVLYVVLLLAAACTAFYMFRLYFLVFEGEFRGTDEQKHHLHESPPAMTVVLWILAIGSFVVGFSGIPDVIHEGSDYFGAWLSPVVAAQAREESLSGFVIAAAIATSASLASIGLAFLLYGKGFSTAVKKIVAAVPRLYKSVVNKYYVDEIYDTVVVRPLRWTAFILWKAVDTFLIDLVFVNGIGFLVAGVGKLVKYLQNGDVQRYVVGMLAGTAGVIYIATNYAACSASNFDVTANGRDVIVISHANVRDAKRLLFRVAWEGDALGAPQTSGVFRKKYESGGKKKIVVEVVDPRWGTVARESRTVTLQ